MLDRICDILQRRLQDRGGPSVAVTGDTTRRTLQIGPRRVRLRLENAAGADQFTFADGPTGELEITGSTPSGLLTGVGKLLRTSRWEDHRWTLQTWRGTDTAQCDMRGIYFATHFHNYYHDAPVEEIVRYVEDQALWGTNALLVWFDMHLYHGISDPDAQAMVARLRAILDGAKRVGMKTGLTALANEAYGDSPPELRAQWLTGRTDKQPELGGHYHVELCPSKPGGMELALAWREEVLTAFDGSELDFLCLWPYDQGGCTCADCKPWGINGYLRLAEPIARMFRQHRPDGQVIFSTWYFDLFEDGEWEGLARAFAQKPDWTDALMADSATEQYPPYPLEHGVPGGLPLLNFPEISMWGIGGWGPWGGFGASPFPRRLTQIAAQTQGRLAGGFPYSEGIYEDINKAVWSRLFWGGTAEDAVREYVSGEFSPDVVDLVVPAIVLLEETLSRYTHGWYKIAQPDGVVEAYRLLREADALLPPAIRLSWRWRILLLRGEIDWELIHNDYHVTDRAEEALQELTRLYHAENAGFAVAPPTREALAAHRPL